MGKVTIRTKSEGPRLHHVAEFIFGESLSTDWDLIQDENCKKHHSIVSLDHQIELRIPRWELLSEKGISTAWSDKMLEALIKWKNNGASEDMPDLFSMVFHLISRYEEYGDSNLDKHRRFTATSSLNYKAGTLEIPVVDQIITYLAQELRILIPTDKRKLISTIDVDLPWFSKNLKFPWYLNKLRHRRSHDPYDTYDELQEVHNQLSIRPIFFFLTSGSSPFEKISRYHTDSYSRLIKSIAKWADIGVHPPYYSLNDPKVMATSIKEFRSLSGCEPLQSRQHFLRIQNPVTFRLLAELGIKKEYSIGYADHTGFRAGTARSFRFYDIERESSSELRLIPFMAMDVTLRDYMKLEPDQSLAKLHSIKSQIDQYGGCFTLLWHNSSLSEIEGWIPYRKVYFDFLRSFGRSTTAD